MIDNESFTFFLFLRCNRLSPTNTRQCTVCLQNKTPDQYDGYYSDHCQHTIRRICNECVYKHTKFTLANINNTTVTCPELLCHEIFNYEGIYQILEIGRDRILFDRYDLRLTVQCLKEMPEFVMCAYPECNSGQLYDSDVSRHCKVTCIKCGRDTCSFHGIPWHTGLTCDEYDQKGRRDPSKKWIRKHTKQCPKCHWNIEKNGGCNHMTCKKCKHEFCWDCSVDYRIIMDRGAHKHRMTCIHYRPKSCRCNYISSVYDYLNVFLFI